MTVAPPHGVAVRVVAVTFAFLALTLTGCGHPNPGADDESLNIFIWADYLAPDTISSFEKATGIKVHVSYFDNNETLESRMLTGHSGFDVVVPTASMFGRQIRSGAYLPVDKHLLPNLVNLDPELMARAAAADPGNDHGIVYTWGTFGIGYDAKAVTAALPGVAMNSWRVIFDPASAAKLAGCGINVIDDPSGIVRLVLKFLGRDPNSARADDLAAAEAALMKIRPYIRNIDTTGDIEALANGDVCVLLAYNGDVVQARHRATEARNGRTIAYSVPEEGSLLWLDMLAIPRDAPHPANAHRFIDYLMQPPVIAHVSNTIGFANGNAAATPLVDATVIADEVVYPPSAQRQRLFMQQEDTPEQARAITRLWQRFKTAN